MWGHSACAKGRKGLSKGCVDFRYLTSYYHLHHANLILECDVVLCLVISPFKSKPNHSNGDTSEVRNYWANAGKSWLGVWYCNAKSWKLGTWPDIGSELKEIQNGGFKMSAIHTNCIGVHFEIYARKNNWKWRNYWLFFLRKYSMANNEETTMWELRQALIRFFSELPWKNMGRGFETVAILLKGEDCPRDILFGPRFYVPYYFCIRSLRKWNLRSVCKSEQVKKSLTKCASEFCL